jgi:hypothetical protein
MDFSIKYQETKAGNKNVDARVNETLSRAFIAFQPPDDFKRIDRVRNVPAELIIDLDEDGKIMYMEVLW